MTIHFSLKDIEAAVCAVFGVPHWDVHSAGIERRVSRPRQVIYYLARELTELSYPAIAAAFGKDHTTVLYGARRVAAMVTADAALMRKISGAKELLAGTMPARSRAAEIIGALPLVGVTADQAAGCRRPECSCGRGRRYVGSNYCSFCLQDRYREKKNAEASARLTRRANLATFAKSWKPATNGGGRT